jgi:hypothetical protein
MEIKYTADNVIQGISIINSDENFNQQIIELIDLINDHKFYNCYKISDRILINKRDNIDILSIRIKHIHNVYITDDAIIISTLHNTFEINSNVSQFIIA